MSTTETPGHVAYKAYAAVLPPLAPWGTPAFADLPDIHQRAWEAVATAVLDAWQTQQYEALDAGEDDNPCPFCREDGCERSCTGALLADEAGEDEP